MMIGADACIESDWDHHVLDDRRGRTLLERDGARMKMTGTGNV
jgi:hypothetical protein